MRVDSLLVEVLILRKSKGRHTIQSNYYQQIYKSCVQLDLLLYARIKMSIAVSGSRHTRSLHSLDHVISLFAYHWRSQGAPRHGDTRSGPSIQVMTGRGICQKSLKFLTRGTVDSMTIEEKV